MAYKKYIKRGDKVFGPYYYHSYRDKDGKVRTRYINTKSKKFDKNKKNPIKRTKILISLSFLILSLWVFISIPVMFSNIQTIKRFSLKITGQVGEEIQCNNADINGDGIVDDTDEALLEAKWGLTNYCGYEDINGDGNVDIQDLTALAGNWNASTGECTLRSLNCDKILGKESDEYVQERLLPFCNIADINGDGIVNQIDNELLSSKWGSTNYCGYEDINEDGKVNILDLTNLASNWNASTGECVTRILGCMNETRIIDKDVSITICDNSDINGDGIVDDTDKTLLEAKWGLTNYCGYEDINGDGNVDIQDLTDLAAKMGIFTGNCSLRFLICLSGTLEGSEKCTPKWKCSDWSECKDNIQTRNCVDFNNCEQNYTPVLRRVCCIEKWDCDWDVCENGISIPTCVDLNNCGTEFNKPQPKNCSQQEKNVLERLSEKKCSPNVICSEWTECQVEYSLETFSDEKFTSNMQYRECTDKNDCISDFTETRECKLKEDVTIIKTKIKDKGAIEIYDSKGELVSTVKESYIEETKKVDINIVI